MVQHKLTKTWKVKWHPISVLQRPSQSVLIDKFSLFPLLFLPQPERINPTTGNQAYDIRSDVWSFGISMIELATGNFPYITWKTPFEQLKQVVKEDPPKLPEGEFSTEFYDFIVQW